MGTRRFRSEENKAMPVMKASGAVLVLVGVIAICTTAQAMVSPNSCMTLIGDGPVWHGFKDFWPNQVTRSGKQSEADDKLESPRSVADRIRNYFDGLDPANKTCIVSRNSVMYSQAALHGVDQNNRNAPLAVNRLHASNGE